MAGIVPNVPCTCFTKAGYIEVVNPFCNHRALFSNGQIHSHSQLGIASFDSPYDEAAKELLADD